MHINSAPPRSWTIAAAALISVAPVGTNGNGGWAVITAIATPQSSRNTS